MKAGKPEVEGEVIFHAPDVIQRRIRIQAGERLAHFVDAHLLRAVLEDERRMPPPDGALFDERRRTWVFLAALVAQGLVGYTRRNFQVPVPRCGSWQELNRKLREHCQKRRGRRLRGHQQSIGERFEKDRERLLPLPAVSYEACEKLTARVTSLSLVRYPRERSYGPDLPGSGPRR